jgi:DNA-binding transcriptional ArsR family regulator
VLTSRAAGGSVVVIAVDVLMMIRPQGRDKQQAYQRDYEAVQGLRTLAQELELAIVVAHHTRKSAADDAQDTISGTLGLAAAADCNIVIARQTDGGFVLDVRGRDVEAQQLAAVFDKAALRWNVTGDAGELRQSETRRAILEALRSAPDGLTPSEIAAATDIKQGTVRMALLRMRAAGEVRKAGSKYCLITVTV